MRLNRVLFPALLREVLHFAQLIGCVDELPRKRRDHAIAHSLEWVRRHDVGVELRRFRLWANGRTLRLLRSNLRWLPVVGRHVSENLVRACSLLLRLRYALVMLHPLRVLLRQSSKDTCCVAHCHPNCLAAFKAFAAFSCGVFPPAVS